MSPQRQAAGSRGSPGPPLLPPAAPVVSRPENGLKPNHLHFKLNGEESADSGLLSALPEDGQYHVQWRGFDIGEAPDEAADWKDPKRPIKRSSIISKQKLPHTKQYQVRVRARLGPCTCAEGNPPCTCSREPCTCADYAYIRCAKAAEDGRSPCMWTPWSPPSKPATPTAPWPTEPVTVDLAADSPPRPPAAPAACG